MWEVDPETKSKVGTPDSPFDITPREINGGYDSFLRSRNARATLSAAIVARRLRNGLLQNSAPSSA